jgi:primosomal protein N' (replication factor Y)
MLPLAAEVKRHFFYRIAEAGRRVLYEGAAKGSSRRSKLTAEEQNREYGVLNYLEGGEQAKMSALRSATGANKGLLEGMVRKKWLVREAVAEERDARRLEKIAVLAHSAGSGEEGVGSREQLPGVGGRLPRLNENQLAVMAELAAVGGRMRVSDLRIALMRAGVPGSTLGTLVKRGLVGIEEAKREFWMGALVVEEKADSSAALRNDKQKNRKKHAHEHALNEAQMEALGTIAAAMDKGGFRPHLLYGITGSGKTAVYFAAMRRALDAGKSALLLVPEIGLTPAMAAQMYAAFAGEVAMLHSQLTPDEFAGARRGSLSGRDRPCLRRWWIWD